MLDKFADEMRNEHHHDLKRHQSCEDELQIVANLANSSNCVELSNYISR